jgi:hypothetical protein
LYGRACYNKVLSLLNRWALAALSYCVCWGVLGETGLRATDIKSVTSFVDVFNGLVAFVLGLFVSLTLTRWWSTLFTHYGGLWGASDDLALLIGALAVPPAPRPPRPAREDGVEPEEDPAEGAEAARKAAALTEARAVVLRYGLLANSLVFQQARRYGDLRELQVSARITSLAPPYIQPP